MLLNPERLSNPPHRAGRQRPAFFIGCLMFICLNIVFAILISQFHAPRGRNSVRRLWHIFPEIHKAIIRMVLRRFAWFFRGSDPHTCAHLTRLATSEKCRADIGGMTGHLPEDPDFRLLPSGPAKSRSKGALFGVDPDCGRETDFWMASAILILSPLLQKKKRSKQ